MSALKDTWLRFRNWVYLAVVIAAGMLGIGLARRKWALGSTTSGDEIDSHLEHIRSLEIARAQIDGKIEASEDDLADLDAEIHRSKREIVRLHEGGHVVPEEDLDAAFEQLGY